MFFFETAKWLTVDSKFLFTVSLNLWKISDHIKPSSSSLTSDSMEAISWHAVNQPLSIVSSNLNTYHPKSSQSYSTRFLGKMIGRRLRHHSSIFLKCCKSSPMFKNWKKTVNLKLVNSYSPTFTFWYLTILSFPEADKDIGIITPYHAQCLKLRSALKNIANDVKIGSVEEFQGQVRLFLFTYVWKPHTILFRNVGWSLSLQFGAARNLWNLIFTIPLVLWPILGVSMVWLKFLVMIMCF